MTDIIDDIIWHLKDAKRLDQIENFYNLCFEHNNEDSDYYKFLMNLHKKNTSEILKYIEKKAFKAITEPGEMIEFFYDLKDYYPGLSFSFFRAVISTSPEREYDIDVMIDKINTLIIKYNIDIDEDLSIVNYYKLIDFNNEDEKLMTYYEDMTKMNQDYIKAQKEISSQNGLIEDLKKQLDKYKCKTQTENNSNIKTKKDIPADRNKIKELEDRISDSQNKIDGLQSIIRSKQKAIKALKEDIHKKKLIPEKDSIAISNIDDNLEDTINMKVLDSGELILPLYSNQFNESISKFPLSLKRKAVKSLTDFAVYNPSILKQTKALKRIKNHYSIRIGLHYRLIFEYIPKQKITAKVLINRKDLEKTINNFGSFV